MNNRQIGPGFWSGQNFCGPGQFAQGQIDASREPAALRDRHRVSRACATGDGSRRGRRSEREVGVHVVVVAVGFVPLHRDRLSGSSYGVNIVIRCHFPTRGRRRNEHRRCRVARPHAYWRTGWAEREEGVGRDENCKRFKSVSAAPSGRARWHCQDVCGLLSCNDFELLNSFIKPRMTSAPEVIFAFKHRHLGLGWRMTRTSRHDDRYSIPRRSTSSTLERPNPRTNRDNVSVINDSSSFEKLHVWLGLRSRAEVTIELDDL